MVSMIKRLPHQTHKPSVTNQPGKFFSQMNLYVFGVIGFEGAIGRLVKMDDARHDLTQGVTCLPSSLLQAVFQLVLPPFQLEFLAKSSTSQNNPVNLIVGSFFRGHYR